MNITRVHWLGRRRSPAWEMQVSWNQSRGRTSSEGIRVLRPRPGQSKPYKKQQMDAIKAALANSNTAQTPQIIAKKRETKIRGGGRGVNQPTTVTQSVANAVWVGKAPE